MAIPLALVGMAVDAGFKAQNAYQQNKQMKALEARAKMRPTLDIPDALQEKRNIAKNMANSSVLPSQGYYENQLGASSARANREIQNTGGSSNDIIAGLTQVDANARSQTNQLAAAGLENQQRNMANYGGVLSEVANQENEMFDFNQNQPYQTEQLKIQSLKDASNRNINNAISTGTDMVQYYDNGRIMDDAMGTNYYGGNRAVRNNSNQTAVANTGTASSPMFTNTSASNASKPLRVRKSSNAWDSDENLLSASGNNNRYR